MRYRSARFVPVLPLVCLVLQASCESSGGAADPAPADAVDASDPGPAPDDAAPPADTGPRADGIVPPDAPADAPPDGAADVPADSPADVAADTAPPDPGPGDPGAADAPADPGPDAAAGCGPEVPFFSNAACISCVEEQCCEARRACNDNAECVALRKCGGKIGCTSGACWEQCKVDHAEGVPDQEVFTSCAGYRCEAQCTSYGEACGMTWTVTPCTDCLKARCCAESFAASQVPDYWAAYYCQAACTAGDAACRQACTDAHAEGAAAWGAVIDCLHASCEAECF